jgi:hypothetical protein
MIHHRTASEVKRFDLFKLIVLIILIILLLLNWLFFSGRGPETSTEKSGEPVAAVTTEVGSKLTAPALDLPAGPLSPGEVILTGSGSPGSDVAVVVDGNVVGQTKVGADGKWSLPVQLNEAKAYQVSAQALDSTGKVAAESAAISLTVAAPASEAAEATATEESKASGGESQATEEAASGSGETKATAEAVSSGGESQATEQAAATSEAAAPTAAAPAEVTAPTLNTPGGAQTAGKVTLTGSAEPGSQVEVIIDGQSIGTAKVGADGTWSLDTELAIAGDYQASVQAIDAKGQAVAASEPLTLTVTEPVTAPILDAPGSAQTAGKVTLTGSAEPGSQVEVIIDGQSIGTAKVDADGTWSLDTELAIAGDYQASVQAVDKSGQVLAASDTITLTVAEAAAQVAAPTLAAPDAALSVGEVELTGTGTPGSTVTIVIDGQEVGQASVDKTGAWSLVTDLAKPGEYQVNVQAVDESGQVLAESGETALLVTAATAEASAVIKAPTLDKPKESLAAGEVELTGTGEPNSEVSIVIDGQEVGTTTVGPNGKWRFTTDLAKAGDYEVKVQAVAVGGRAGAESEPTTLAVSEPGEAVSAGETAAPTTACSEVYIVQKDDWLTKLALKYYNEMFDYPLIVDATNAKAREDSTFLEIPNPDLIEVGQKLCIPEKP